MIEEWQYELKLGNEKALQRVFSEYYTTLCSIVFQYVKDNQISENTVKYHIKTVLAYLRKELSPYILSLLVAVLSAE